MLRLPLRLPLNSKPNHVVLHSTPLPSFCFSSILRDEVPAINASMLTTAVFELVQQFYHATEIGNAANAVRVALINISRQNKDNCFRGTQS